MKPDAQARIDAYLHMKLHSPEEFYQSEHPFWKRELANIGLDSADLGKWDAFTLSRHSDLGQQLGWITYVVVLILGRELFFVVFIAHGLISLGVDTLITLRTMGYWHAELQSAEWEQLRLTPQTDERLVDMLFALAQVRERKLLAFDAAKRIIPATMMFIGLVSFTAILLLFMPFGSTWIVRDSATILAVGAWNTLILPAHESVWRVRAVQAVAAWAATIAPEQTGGIAIAIGYVFANRLVLGAIIVTGIAIASVLSTIVRYTLPGGTAAGSATSVDVGQLLGILVFILMLCIIGPLTRLLNWLVIRHAMLRIVERVRQ